MCKLIYNNKDFMRRALRPEKRQNAREKRARVKRGLITMQQNIYEPDLECAPREVLHWIQSRRLIKMVERCYNNVPFYKKRFDELGLLPGDIKSIDDVVKLPFTNKNDLRDNYPFGLFAVPKEELVRIHASSGTTGKQTVVGYTKNDIDVWARGAARAIVAAGGTKSDYVHVSDRKSVV